MCRKCFRNTYTGITSNVTISRYFKALQSRYEIRIALLQTSGMPQEQEKERYVQLTREVNDVIYNNKKPNNLNPNVSITKRRERHANGALQFRFLLLLPLSNLFHCHRLVFLYLKHPNMSFFNVINILTSFTHTITLLSILLFFV